MCLAFLFFISLNSNDYVFDCMMFETLRFIYGLVIVLLDLNDSFVYVCVFFFSLGNMLEE